MHAKELLFLQNRFFPRLPLFSKTLVTGTMNREEALMNVVRHPLLQGRPFILETPNEDVVKLL
jgi:hypothetical protein